MRRHHQEAHVIADLLIGEQRSVFFGRATELREQIRRTVLPAPRYLLSEESKDRLTALHAFPHLRPRNGSAHYADDGSHHIHEGNVYGCRLRTEFDPKE